MAKLSPELIVKLMSSNMVRGCGVLTLLETASAMTWTISTPIKKFCLLWITFVVITLNPIRVLSQPDTNVLLIVGDSLSAAYRIPKAQGWVNLLTKKIAETHPNIQVINLSRSGDTTLEGLQKLSSNITQHQPRWIILELGGNDGLRGLSPKMIENNLRKMIQLSQNSGAKVLLVGITLPRNYGTLYIRAFDKIYPRLAKEFDLPLVPFLLENVAETPDLMQQDGIHPTAKAQPILTNNVWKVISSSDFLNSSP